MRNAGNRHREPVHQMDAGMGYEQYAPKQYDYSTKGTWSDIVSAFGGVLLLVTACLELLQGMSAVANDDLYSSGSPYLYEFDMTVWGWTHIAIAVVSAIVAVGILARKRWGQVTGVIVSALSMVANFAFIPRYPLWSLVLIAFNVLVMWALTTQLKNYR